ncbi:hypothetical protein M427DRAFT_270315 [Gonapodya prolifera JEL478]|uniref:Uncharacterized protein n=1 Tax=Gonapodya prolifera (strain JEL478) TaxID=1344416 RepID=A0A138ZX95_GONPJ|nr:hypothetical protein M427DRAFT_270315 [Gonapodya prolifera JEL478]|eukprot:KXS08905.1 hypothetical protein M427DRAFT_270315 [Gonapodya prolifera JEL478]
MPPEQREKKVKRCPAEVHLSSVDLTKELGNYSKREFEDYGIACGAKFREEYSVPNTVLSADVEDVLDTLIQKQYEEINEDQFHTLIPRILKWIQSVYPPDNVFHAMAKDGHLVDATEETPNLHGHKQVRMFMEHLNKLHGINNIDISLNPTQQKVVHLGVKECRGKRQVPLTEETLEISTKEYEDTWQSDILPLHLQTQVTVRRMSNGTVTNNGLHCSEAKVVSHWWLTFDLARELPHYVHITRDQVPVDGVHGLLRPDETTTLAITVDGKVVYVSSATIEAKSGQNPNSDSVKVLKFAERALRHTVKNAQGVDATKVEVLTLIVRGDTGIASGSRFVSDDCDAIITYRIAPPVRWTITPTVTAEELYEPLGFINAYLDRLSKNCSMLAEKYPTEERVTFKRVRSPSRNRGARKKDSTSAGRGGAGDADEDVDEGQGVVGDL